MGLHFTPASLGDQIAVFHFSEYHKVRLCSRRRTGKDKSLFVTQSCHQLEESSNPYWRFPKVVTPADNVRPETTGSNNRATSERRQDAVRHHRPRRIPFWRRPRRKGTASLHPTAIGSHTHRTNPVPTRFTFKHSKAAPLTATSSIRFPSTVELTPVGAGMARNSSIFPPWGKWLQYA